VNNRFRGNFVSIFCPFIYYTNYAVNSLLYAVDSEENAEAVKFMEAKEYNKAIIIFENLREKGVENQPLLINLSNSYNYLGNDYLSKMQLEKALEFFESSLKVMPNNRHTHYCMGITYSKLNKIDYAIDSFQKALNNDWVLFFKLN